MKNKTDCKEKRINSLETTESIASFDLAVLILSSFFKLRLKYITYLSKFLCSRKTLVLPSDVESSRAWWLGAGNMNQVKRVTFALFLFSLITSYKLCYLVGSVQTKRFYQINAFQFRHCSKMTTLL